MADTLSWVPERLWLPSGFASTRHSIHVFHEPQWRHGAPSGRRSGMLTLHRPQNRSVTVVGVEVWDADLVGDLGLASQELVVAERGCGGHWATASGYSSQVRPSSSRPAAFFPTRLIHRDW